MEQVAVGSVVLVVAGRMNTLSPAPFAPASPEALDALRSHPHFAAAMRASSAGMLEMYRGSRLLNWLIDDRGQLLFSYYTLYLHFTPDDGGLSPTRLKTICKDLDICSAGRAAAMLHLMRRARYIESDTNVADRRRRQLLATPAFIEMFRQRWRLHFAAMAPLFSDGEDLRYALEDPAFFRTFVMTMESVFRGGFRFTTDPQLRRVVDRNAGIMIMASLIAGGAADDTVPPSRPVPLSVSALAKRFSVSRAHVVGLLDDAASAELLTRSQAEQTYVTVLPRLAHELQNFFAQLFLCFSACARVALKVTAAE